MDVNYFIKKFGSIPAALWTTDTLYNGWTHQRCAAGFCDNTEMQPLSKLFHKYFGIYVAAVNDGILSQPFHAATPKERVLEALEFIKQNYGL